MKNNKRLTTDNHVAKTTSLSSRSKQTLLMIGSLVFIISTGITVFLYIQHRDRYPSTDDAYVETHVVQLAPQVSGSITAIAVYNNQIVNKGEVLFTIDNRPFQAHLSKAKAQLKIANQSVAGAADAIKEGEAEVNRMSANLEVTRKYTQRILQLVKTEQASLAAGDNARGQLKSAQAAYQAACNKLAKIKANLGELNKQNAAILNALADVKNAEWNLEHTQIKAPADGIITNFNLRPGTSVQAGIPLFQLVETNQWWINANYKETQLNRLKPGQVATIKVDMYPKVTFKGVVDSISRGSGAAFSLLPPENASGNWVKVVQRFPVKILFVHPPKDYPLRVGASSTITVDTVTKPQGLSN